MAQYSWSDFNQRQHSAAVIHYYEDTLSATTLMLIILQPTNFRVNTKLGEGSGTSDLCHMTFKQFTFANREELHSRCRGFLFFAYDRI